MSVSRWEIMLDSYAAANPREAQGTFYAELRRMLARVSELEQENDRLHGVIAHTASDVHDYVRAALADARTERDAALARADRAEAQVRAVLNLCDEAENRAWPPFPVTVDGKPFPRLVGVAEVRAAAAAVTPPEPTPEPKP